MVIYNINQIIYSLNQITLGDMNMENVVGQPHNPLLQQGQLTEIVPIHQENTKNALNRWWASLPQFTLPLRAERHGHALQQLIDFQYLQYKSNYLQYKSNYTRRTWTWEILWVSPSTSSSATVNSSGDGPTHLEKQKKKNWQLILWAGSSPYSSGTGPAQLHVVKGQLI